MKHSFSQFKRSLLSLAAFLEFGDGIIGANVIVKGTTNGGTTDLDGNFTIQDVKTNDVLSVSYIGYITEEIVYTGQKTIDITYVCVNVLLLRRNSTFFRS